jgi:hypothetical protein
MWRARRDAGGGLSVHGHTASTPLRSATGGFVVSLPWYLLAFGIALVVIGFLLAALPRSSDRSQRAIDTDMRDEDIVRELQRTQRVSVPGLVILAGFTCILVSIGWRILRAIF